MCIRHTVLDSRKVGDWEMTRKVQLGIISIRMDRTRSLIWMIINGYNKKRVGDRTEHWGTPL